MNKYQLSLLAMGVLSVNAQIFYIDNFEAGDFQQTGPGIQTHEANVADVIGGTRWFRMYNNDESSAELANGTLTVTKTDSTIFLLRYGTFAEPNDAEHLHLNLQNYQLSIDVSSVTGPMTIWVDTYSYAEDESGNTLNYYAGRPAEITEAGTVDFFPWEYYGHNDLTDIAGIEIQLASGTGTRGIFSVDSMTLTPIPEPSTYAAMFGLGLAGFAVVRRKLAGRREG